MLQTPAGRGVMVGLLLGAVAGTLFGLFIICLDTEIGRDIVTGIALARKDHQDQVFDKFPEDRAKASGFVGLILGLSTAWLVRQLIQQSPPTVPTDQPPEKLSGLLITDLIEMIVFGLVAVGCGLVSLQQASPGSPTLFVLLAAAGMALLAGAYGLLVGWRKGRRQEKESSKMNPV
jgi:hypothetical protein